MTPQTKVSFEGEGRRILVIDDDIAIRVLLHAVLTRMKLEVDLAEDGQDGLARLNEGQYDLILLDLMMPRMNGYEFLDAVSKKATVRPHIIVFTAAGKRGVDKIPPDKICTSILKPFDLDTFVELIGRCLLATDGSHTTASP